MLRHFAIVFAAASSFAPAVAQTVPANVPARAVEQSLADIAARSRTPAALGHGVVLTQVAAHANELRLTMVSQARGQVFTSADRAGVINDLCTLRTMLPLYRKGASARAVINDFNGAELATVVVGAADCGIGRTMAMLP